MITSRQQPRPNSVHGPYVRVAVADLEVGNRYVFGAGPNVGRIATLDRPPHHLYGTAPKLGYRWVNEQQRELQSWRDVLVSTLTPAQRAAIVEGEAVR